jgi:hypothetical protein
LPPVGGQCLWGQYHPRDVIRDVGATTTRSFGGSLASMWTKYSIMARERCSAR